MNVNPIMILYVGKLNHSLSHPCEHNRTTMATQDQEMYLAILKASYNYEPQSEDEIAIKEDQLLFLIERVDEESVVL